MKKDDDLKKPKGQVYEVPPGGSLGLLALGYRGLEAWREALKNYTEEKKARENGKEKS